MILHNRFIPQILTRFMRFISNQWVCLIAKFIVEVRYSNFWDYRKNCGDKLYKGIWYKIYYHSLKEYNSYIGIHAQFDSVPKFPHKLYGIFISDKAKIGKNCTIFQHVTIGSNTIQNSKNFGSPTIGDNVYIGAGAKIIGGVKIGDNCRIGAGCVVVKDMPPNTTAVAASTRYLESQTPLNNTFIPMYKLNSAGF